jgi:serine protease
MARSSRWPEGNPIEYPAGYGPQVNGAMTVGAVGRSRRRAYYSNTGASIEIAAPGGDDRDGGLAGAIFQTGIFDPDFDPSTIAIPRFDRYYDKPDEGTSMATPHIAGVAALLYAQGIHNPAAIEAAIKRFAVDLGPPGRDDEYGAGLVDARAALRGLGVAR